MSIFKKFNDYLLKRKSITQSDIDIISDLFLDVSDSLTEVITPEEEGRYGNSQLGDGTFIDINNISNGYYSIYGVGRNSDGSFEDIHIDIKIKLEKREIRYLNGVEGNPTLVEVYPPKSSIRIPFNPSDSYQCMQKMKLFMERITKFPKDSNKYKYRFIDDYESIQDGTLDILFIRIIINK